MEEVTTPYVVIYSSFPEVAIDPRPATVLMHRCCVRAPHGLSGLCVQCRATVEGKVT